MDAEEDIIKLRPYDYREESVGEEKPVNRWIRVALLVLTVPWIVVFIIATQLDPYRGAGGEPLRLGTHQQLGLPECNFKSLVGIPCPSCGMTTSFSLLVRADVWNSLKANFAGTVLATLGLLFIPWALASAFLGRFVFVRSIEILAFWIALGFLVLLFGRWAIVVILELLAKS
jgi:hypothetical protein